MLAGDNNRIASFTIVWQSSQSQCKGLIDLLHAAREEALPAETGGVLLGYIDFNVNSIVVVDALSAPPDSEGSMISFERGVAGLAKSVEEASRRTAGVVGYVGEWHSHPRGHSASPSARRWQVTHFAWSSGAISRV